MSAVNIDVAEKAYVIILNWNGWRDTIECLESVFRNEYHNFNVIVVDNKSEDNSLSFIKDWARGKTASQRTDTGIQIETLTTPPIKKPIEFVQYTKDEAEDGGNACDNARLILIQTGSNLGFAGGNNVALRYVLRKQDYKYVWLLNNDTVVDKYALSHMVQRIRQDKHIGMCGSTLLYYCPPHLLQAQGGAVYNKWLGISRHISAFNDNSDMLDRVAIEKKLNYVIGASMMISAEFLQEVGLMSEDYFLYYEEIDWALRARGRYVLGYAPESVVYHKEGASICSSKDYKKQSIIADYYSIKNRIVFTKKYYKFALPTVYAGILVSLVNRVIRGQWDRVLLVIKILFGCNGVLPKREA